MVRFIDQNAKGRDAFDKWISIQHKASFWSICYHQPNIFFSGTYHIHIPINEKKPYCEQATPPFLQFSDGEQSLFVCYVSEKVYPLNKNVTGKVTILIAKFKIALVPEKAPEKVSFLEKPFLKMNCFQRQLFIIISTIV